MKKYFLLTLSALILFAAGTANAALVETFGFYGITSNSPGNIITGQAQIFVDLHTTAVPNEVMFTFRNIGPEVCALTEVYFDDGSLLGVASIIDNPPGVDFRLDDVEPKNLPGANLADPDFVATTGFSLEPENPEPFHGVNPGEELSVIFTLNGAGATVSDVLGELYNGDLRIGIHMQAFEDGDSDSFVNNVPEPATIAMLSLGGVFLFRKRRIS